MATGSQFHWNKTLEVQVMKFLKLKVFVKLGGFLYHFMHKVKGLLLKSFL